jgi:hypothetical protein
MPEIINLPSYFPRFMDEEAIENIMFEISKVELKLMVESFQKHKT